MKNYIIRKIEALRNYFVSKSSKYETRPEIKKEFVEFLDWYRTYYGNHDFEHSQQLVVNTYLHERNIAFVGDLRKLHGANTRNASFELALVITMAVVGSALGILIGYYFIG